MEEMQMKTKINRTGKKVDRCFTPRIVHQEFRASCERESVVGIRGGELAPLGSLKKSQAWDQSLRSGLLGAEIQSLS
jgi:hypothetical protein